MCSIPLQIRGSGESWVILQNGRPLPQRYQRHDAAQLGLRALERRLEPTLSIPCLCCGENFPSTGKANRLCKACKENE